MDVPSKAPDFTLLDQDGVLRSLADYVGKWLVIYFYPRDNTPSCTTQACSFRDERELIAELGDVEVLGVSKDSVKSHKKFAEAHSLNFGLLSDPDHQMIEAYDSWNLRKFMGREYMGTQRNTFIISPDGLIVAEFRDAKTSGHANLILNELIKLRTT